MGPQSTTRRRTGTFTATGRDGQGYVVHVYTWTTRTHGVGGLSVEVEGRRELETATGHGVTRLGRGRYLVDVTGVELHSSDPFAP
jgi:hypothetical protein